VIFVWVRKDAWKETGEKENRTSPPGVGIVRVGKDAWKKTCRRETFPPWGGIGNKEGEVGWSLQILIAGILSVLKEKMASQRAPLWIQWPPNSACGTSPWDSSIPLNTSYVQTLRSWEDSIDVIVLWSSWNMILLVYPVSAPPMTTPVRVSQTTSLYLGLGGGPNCLLLEISISVDVKILIKLVPSPIGTG